MGLTRKAKPFLLFLFFKESFFSEPWLYFPIPGNVSVYVWKVNMSNLHSTAFLIKSVLIFHSGVCSPFRCGKNYLRTALCS